MMDFVWKPPVETVRRCISTFSGRQFNVFGYKKEKEINVIKQTKPFSLKTLMGEKAHVIIATAWNAKNQFPTHLVVISHYYTFQNQFSKWPNIFRFAWFEK